MSAAQRMRRLPRGGRVRLQRVYRPMKGGANSTRCGWTLPTVRVACRPGTDFNGLRPVAPSHREHAALPPGSRVDLHEGGTALSLAGAGRPGDAGSQADGNTCVRSSSQRPTAPPRTKTTPKRTRWRPGSARYRSQMVDMCASRCCAGRPTSRRLDGSFGAERLFLGSCELRLFEDICGRA
jgi:hypothetical protein